MFGKSFFAERRVPYIMLRRFTCTFAGRLCRSSKVFLSAEGGNKKCLRIRSASTGPAKLCSAEWNRVIAEAEKLLGFPNIFQPLQSLPDDSVFSMIGDMRKLLRTNHPFLDMAKRLIYNSHSSMQTRGLILLLMCKVFSKPYNRRNNLDQLQLEDIATKQRHVATITELVHTAFLIHKGVVNLADLVYDETLNAEDIEFGNKLSILFGDYFLANATLLLGNIRVPKVTYIVSAAIRDIVEGEFFFEQNSRGNAIPTDSTTIKEWEVRTFFSSASLLANCCKSILILGNYDDASQEHAFEFGKHLGLAWQISNELQYFTNPEKHPVGSPFELISAPVILHLQREQSILDLLSPRQDDSSDKVDYKKIHTLVTGGPALKEAQEICRSYVQGASRILSYFPASEARSALENIVLALQFSE